MVTLFLFVSPCEFHHARESVIKERWEQARPLIPEDLHQELWNILSEPLA